MPGTSKVLKFDDTIHCRLFSRSKSVQNNLEQWCGSINDNIDSITQGYIWNRDEFKVSIPLQTDPSDGDLPYLSSITCFGDNIEDEWFIVYVIYELTRRFDDLIVHVEDNDGSFLLIEAAEYLPSWLNPDNADNRVLIHQNRLHIITPQLISLDTKLQICEAVTLVTCNPEKTITNTAIQDAIMKKIFGYPQKIKDCMHTAIVSLPVEVAAILKLKPSLISPLVNTYCNHDVLDAKICRKVNYTNCIKTQLKFTKYLYAMLMHSKLLKDIHNKIPEIDKKMELGLKLTCGYDIIMKQYRQDTFASSEYKKYITNLSKTGYFKNNIEGSNEYQQLLEKAKLYFLNVECSIKTHMYNEITCLKSDKSFEEMKEHLVQSQSTEFIEDSDDWLNIGPDQLNDILTSQYGNKMEINTEDYSQNITFALTDFLKKNSDFEGIERMGEDVEDNSIDFNVEQFANCLEKFLNIATSNEDIQLSEESEYDDDIEDEIDKELAAKLSSVTKTVDDKTILNNLVQSMKEEGLSGPSSNILKTIGINKTDLLDSDDE